jgi:hypothetical protein
LIERTSRRLTFISAEVHLLEDVVAPVDRATHRLKDRLMSLFRITLAFASLAVFANGVYAQTSPSPTAAPGQNFDLSAYRLQTLDTNQQFTEVSPIDSHQDPYFFTDPKTGAMTFRAPAGAGHSIHSEYPRVELRQVDDFAMSASGGQPHAEAVVLRVVGEPQTGKLIFAQIHGEKIGTELLKMRWTHGDILMGVKAQPGAHEQQIPLLHGLSLGDVIECHIVLENDTATVSVRSGSREAKQSFTYDANAWKDQPLYFKVGNYTQDKERDGSEGVVAVERLKLAK